jgi:hypothetical protein
MIETCMSSEWMNRINARSDHRVIKLDVFSMSRPRCLHPTPLLASWYFEGEAYDKVARLLGLELNPNGGAALEAFARQGNPQVLRTCCHRCYVTARCRRLSWFDTLPSAMHLLISGYPLPLTYAGL